MSLYRSTLLTVIDPAARGCPKSCTERNNVSVKFEVEDFEDCSLLLFLDSTGKNVLSIVNATLANDPRILSV